MTADPPTPPAGYLEAVGELDAILAELEGEVVDVDVLAGRVRRAAELIAFCRDRIDRARLEVTVVVADLADEPPEGGEDDRP